MMSKGGEIVGIVFFLFIILSGEKALNCKSKWEILVATQHFKKSHFEATHDEQVKFQRMFCHHQKGGECEEEFFLYLFIVLMKTNTS